MLDLLNAGLLGIVEGITEFLPISSTAHLILTAKLLNLPQTEYLKSFEIIIQLGAISSVVVLYWKKLWQWEIIKRLIVAFIPTGIIGLLVYKMAKEYLLGNTSVVLWALLIGGILIIAFEYMFKQEDDSYQDITNMTYRQCLAIGLFQSIAIVPGVSRSAATVIGGLLIGLNRKTIVEFSFLLAVPTMLAASSFDLLKSANQFSMDQAKFLAVGFVVSFVVALLSIKFLLKYIKNHDFKAFGVYRIVIAILLWVGIR